MPKKTITVCDACLRACCWKGIFMCDDARDAGTVERTVEQCVALGEEHSDYWDGTYEAGDERLS
jgi:hypothetical protein